MKKLLLLILLVVPLRAQLNIPTIVHQTVNPTGACPGWQLWVNDNNTTIWYCAANVWVQFQNGGAGGTVTSFSAGTLSPLFTTSVATPTTTPALTFTLTNAAAFTIFGNNTNVSAGPTYVSMNTLFGSCSGASNALTFNTGTSTFGCNTIGGISGLTTGFIPQAASSTTLTNSPIDNGITVSSRLTTTEAINFSGTIGELWTFTNDTVTGTTANQLVEISAGKTINAAASSQNVFGICVDNCGTSGSSTILIVGKGTCAFSNGVTQDDYVTPSSTGGKCNDAGSTFPTNAQVVGRVLNATSGGAGNYTVDFMLGDVFSPGGGKGKGVTTGSGTLGYVTLWTGGSSIGTSSTSANQQLFWDNTNFRLGIGTAAPSYPLDIEENSASDLRAQIVNLGSGRAILLAEGNGTNLIGQALVELYNNNASSDSVGILYSGASGHNFYILKDPGKTATDILSFNDGSTFDGSQQAMEIDGKRVVITNGVGAIGANAETNVGLVVLGGTNSTKIAAFKGSYTTGAATGAFVSFLNLDVTNMNAGIYFGRSDSAANQWRVGSDLLTGGTHNFFIADTGFTSGTSRALIYINNSQQLSFGDAGSGVAPSLNGDVTVFHHATNAMIYCVGCDTPTNVDSTGADVGSTTVYANGASDAFIEIRANVICQSAVAGTETLTINFTHADGSSTADSFTTSGACTTLGASSIGSIVQATRVKASTNVTFTTTHSGSQPTYGYSVRVFQLSAT